MSRSESRETDSTRNDLGWLSVVCSGRGRCGRILVIQRMLSEYHYRHIQMQRRIDLISSLLTRPDIVTIAKPLANGFPIGAIMVRDNVADVMTVGEYG